MKKIANIYLFQQVCQAVGMTVPLSYIVFFMTNSALLAPAIVAAILTIARIVDFVVCLVAGPILQKANFKMGKYRPWLLYGSIIVQVGAFMMFINPNVSMIVKAVIIGAGYVLNNAPMSFVMTSTYGLQAKICGPDMNARLSISARMMQGMNVGNLVAAIATMPCITFLVGKGMNGYLIVAIVYGILMIVGAATIVTAAKEFDKYDPNFKADDSANLKLSQIYGDSLKNPQVWVILIKDTLMMTSMYYTMGVLLYYFQYSIGNLNMQALAATISTLLGVAAAFVMPPLAKKLGKKNSVVVASTLGAVLCTIQALVIHERVVLYIVFASLILFASALTSAIGINMYLDAAEYQLYKTGKDTRAFIMSLNNLPMKIGMIISTPLVSFVLVKSGFVQDMATGQASMSDPKLFVLLMCLVPAAINLLMALLVGLGYRITDAKAQEYAEANHKAAMERQNAAQAAE